MTIDIVGVGAAGLYSINDEGAGLIALRPTSKGVGWCFSGGRVSPWYIA